MRKNVSRLIGAKKKHEYGETSNSNTYCEDEFISPIVLATLYALPFQKKTFIIKIVVFQFSPPGRVAHGQASHRVGSSMRRGQHCH